MIFCRYSLTLVRTAGALIVILLVPTRALAMELKIVGNQLILSGPVVGVNIPYSRGMIHFFHPGLVKRAGASTFMCQGDESAGSVFACEPAAPACSCSHFQRAEGVLDVAETFIGAHRGGGIGVCGRQVGADHIDAVERSLGGDAEVVLGEAERIVGDADVEMLGHVAPSQHRPDGLANLPAVSNLLDDTADIRARARGPHRLPGIP